MVADQFSVTGADWRIVSQDEPRLSGLAMKNDPMYFAINFVLLAGRSLVSPFVTFEPGRDSINI